MPLLLEIPDNMCIAIVCYPACDVMNFLYDQKFRTKIEISQVSCYGITYQS